MWINLRQRSYCMRSGSAESPYPRWHQEHGMSSSSGVKGLSVTNSGEMCMWVMGTPLSRCAFATWKGHINGYHSTRHGVVRLGLVL
jgi:hypothetical protein